MNIFCSTIIPTIGREALSRAVCSVLDQEFGEADFEVIVVNDSGRPLPAMAWQDSERVRIIHTNRRERSVARNAGAAIAQGKYLHFLDDDDLLLPGALKAFWKLDKEGAGAARLYGSYQTVDNDGNLVEIFHPRITGNFFAWAIVGESIPFQASLLQTKHFYAVGTFDPHPVNIGVEDRDVGRRLSFDGMVDYTPEIVAQIRIGEESSTTNWETIAESDRWGREKALRINGATGRLRSLANTTELRNRVSRAYFASAAWNFRRRAGFTVASRVLAGITFAGMRIFTPNYWSVIKTNKR